MINGLIKIILSFILIVASINCWGQQKIVVAKDGSGDYTTVQEAFDAIPLNNNKRIIIQVKPGIYKEKLQLARTKNMVSLFGEEPATTILTFDDHTGKKTASGTTINTYTSASFFMHADDFCAENITFENNAGFNAGQAVAVYSFGDRAIYSNCRFLGFQDVLFLPSKRSRQYFNNCYIEGTTDFIFGDATALFEKCTIHSKKNSHITAASTPKENAFGYVFKNCRLTGDSALHNVTLGRPWQPYASVTYLRCYMGPHITKAGWDNWKNTANETTARYAEYKNFGPGAEVKERVKWSRQLTSKEAKKFKAKNILSGWKPRCKN